jgi:hypothetical protein
MSVPVAGRSADAAGSGRGGGSSHVLVLRDGVDAAAVLALADAEGWRLREETARAHLVLASRRWVTTSGEVVTWVVDHPGGASSLRIEGTGAAALTRRLRDRLPCHDEDELLAVVLSESADPVQLVRVASKLAACRPERADPRHVDALARLIGHDVEGVRRAGIRSAYGCRWPELREVVQAQRGKELRLLVQLVELRRWLDAEGVG